MNSYDETHLLMCEKEELVKYILELRERDEEAMKLSMTQNEAFMNQLERKDSVIGDRNEEIENWHKENNSLTKQLNRFPENSAGYTQEEFEEMVNVMEDITEHHDYEDKDEEIDYQLIKVGKYMKLKKDDLFIDIFILDEGVWPQKHYSNLSFINDEYKPFRKAMFGSLEVSIPHKAEEYLHRILPEWNNKAIIYNHKSKGKKTISLNNEMKKPYLPCVKEGI